MLEPGGPGGPLAPPIFGRSVNPIPTWEGRLSPPITTGTPNFFHLPALLGMVIDGDNCSKSSHWGCGGQRTLFGARVWLD
jgi:hypothetical protein